MCLYFKCKNLPQCESVDYISIGYNGSLDTFIHMETFTLHQLKTGGVNPTPHVFTDKCINSLQETLLLFSFKLGTYLNILNNVEQPCQEGL